MREAMWFEPHSSGSVKCLLCPQGCVIGEGKRGICGVRENDGGRLLPMNYGLITSIAADPVEKKPLRHFLPGTRTLSCGSFGCNLMCMHCQNWQIARGRPGAIEVTPQAFVAMAREQGCPSVAFTYNEPTVFYEWVLDTARVARAVGLKTILVTNGFLNTEPLLRLLPHIDAMNVDLKAFTEVGYQKVGGRLKPVMEFIERASAACHVEVTMLLVPGIVDTAEEVEAAAQWLASLSPELPLHLSRCFPAFRHTAAPTSLELMNKAAEAARRHLRHVYLGNV